MSRRALLLLAAGCAARTVPTAPPAPAASASIDAGDLLRHVKVLSSDDFEGRLPGTPGEEKTVAYLSAEMRKLGLQPGNPDGTWVQAVPLVGIDGKSEARLTAGGKQLALEPRADYVAVTSRFERSVAIEDTPLVFVGYGVVAPEYGWDDYKGLDVKGKTVVVLINDPPLPDDKMFKGKAMTYYGRWTYKYEMASQKGAAGVLIVHETEPAGYGWDVVRNSWTGEQFELAAADGNRGNVAVQGWISLEKARELFTAARQDLDGLKKAALSRDFQPVPLDARLSVTIVNQVREVSSRNVLGRLPGSDPALADQHILYTAHWDHLGRDATREGDQIFNGARDNATGTAALLEIAEAFTRLPSPPRRSILFVAVTAEEQGTFGSRWYAMNPLFPLEKTVAAINMDALNPWGATRDMLVIGMGQNTLEDDLAAVVKAHGRVLVADPEPEKGYYYRSDQFELAKVGVPALYADGGTQLIGKPEGLGKQLNDAYAERDYHAPSDEVKPDWDLSGLAGDARVLFEVGLRVAQADRWPEWKPGSEFKALREASLRRTSP
jgi:Zn-dependent M28 family amino/carboxypeptidase